MIDLFDKSVVILDIAKQRFVQDWLIFAIILSEHVDGNYSKDGFINGGKREMKLCHGFEKSHDRTSTDRHKQTKKGGKTFLDGGFFVYRSFCCGTGNNALIIRGGTFEGSYKLGYTQGNRTIMVVNALQRAGGALVKLQSSPARGNTGAAIDLLGHRVDGNWKNDLLRIGE